MKHGIGTVINWHEFNKNIRGIIREFDALPLDETIRKPRVGIVGEILVKFMPAANNYLIEQLEAEGAEVIVPELLNFMLYCSYDNFFKHDYLGKSKKSAVANGWAIKIMEKARKASVDAFKQSKRFDPPARIEELAEYASPIVSNGNQTGEGWFLTGEMIELIKAGAPNIVCAQPFACLPNHIVGKGVIKELRRRYPDSNIVAVDYDPGASEVNQLNRIKLMLSAAQRNL
jgi:predicted nucleotide-binding protein (sugar kinase/HSP70/actin superfamily)